MSFKLPTNIRQIGTIGSGIKIYMEDYVHTYLKQYADSGLNSEKVAFLVGKYMIVDSIPYLFISGAIQGKHSKYEDNMEIFTKESYDYAHEELDSHFGEFEIVGWMQSQPGYGTHINPSYADYHMNNFTRPYQVLLVIDQILKQNSFYAWNEGMTGIEQKEGFFVYYESNPGMQAYMQENRIARVSLLDRENLAHSQNIENDTKNFEIDLNNNKQQKSAAPPKPRQRRIKTTEKPKPSKEVNLEEYKKVSNLLVGLCAVLFITTFVMGAGILQSDSRIGALENSLNTISTTHNNLANQINQLASLPVFADTTNEIAAAPAGDTQQDQDYTQTQPEPTSPDTIPEPDEIPDEVPDEHPEPDEIHPEDVHPLYEEVTQYVFNVPETYIVQPGDSLLLISQMFYGTTDMVARIMEINSIYYADMIRIGDIIQLPRY